MIKKATHAGEPAELYCGLARVYDLFTNHEPAHHRKAVELAGVKPKFDTIR